MPLAAVANNSLNYSLDGPEGAPVVILSNSLGSDMTMWSDQFAGLAQRFRVLRYDTRGHGLSEARGKRYSLSDLGTDVLGLADVLEIDQFHICGVSLGGMTALWLGVHAPARVLSVMPCNTAARIGSEESWSARIEQVRAGGLPSIADATMERWFTACFRKRSPARVELAKHALLRTDEKGYLACCAALRDADLTADISAISAPVCIISGTQDPVTPAADGRFLQERIRSATYCELDAAHIANIEQPQAYLEAMLDFIGRCSIE